MVLACWWLSQCWVLSTTCCCCSCCILSLRAVNPTQERAHGAGMLVAESVLGPEHNLHSKAGSVLALLLQEDLLTPEDFGAAADRAAAGKAAKAPKGAGRQEHGLEFLYIIGLRVVGCQAASSGKY